MNKQELEKGIQEMKMCPICDFDEKSDSFIKLQEVRINLHRRNGTHLTKNLAWSPLKGHPLYNLHIEWSKKLNYTI